MNALCVTSLPFGKLALTVVVRALVGLLTVAAGTQSWAMSSTGASVSGEVGTYGEELKRFSDGSADVLEPVSAGGALSANSVYAGLTNSSSAAATAYADFGVLKAFSRAAGSGLAGANASAIASFSDSITIERAGSSGLSGIIATTIAFSWTGSVVGDSGAQGQAGARLELNGGLGIVGAESVSFIGLPSISGYSSLCVQDLTRGYCEELPLAERVTVQQRFYFGQPIEFQMRLTTGVNASSGSSAVMDATNSAYWGGFSVTLEDGTPVSDFTLSSDSGTNWRNSLIPVPEPATWGLMLVGVAAVVSVARRRRY